MRVNPPGRRTPAQPRALVALLGVVTLLFAGCAGESDLGGDETGAAGVDLEDEAATDEPVEDDLGEEEPADDQAAAVDDQAAAEDGAEVQTFTVTVTNVSKSTGTKVETPKGAKPILLSPGAYAVYSGDDNPSFTVGEEATVPLGGEGLENIAEDGFPMKLAQQFKDAPSISDSGTFADPDGPKKGFEPGMSTTFTVTASPGDKLTLITMFVPSNDAFYGPADGIELFDGEGNPVDGNVTDALGTFDAGTEENQEFFGPATKPVQPQPDFGPVEDSVVLPVEEVEGQPQVYPDVGQVIEVTVTPTASG